MAEGRPIAQIAADLGISDQTIYSWRKQEPIDTGQLPGLNRLFVIQSALMSTWSAPLWSSARSR